MRASPGGNRGAPPRHQAAAADGVCRVRVAVCTPRTFSTMLRLPRTTLLCALQARVDHVPAHVREEHIALALLSWGAHAPVPIAICGAAQTL